MTARPTTLSQLRTRQPLFVRNFNPAQEQDGPNRMLKIAVGPGGDGRALDGTDGQP